MERPQRKRLRLPEYDYAQLGSYFITICTKERHQEILCSIEPAVGGDYQSPAPDFSDIPGADRR